MPFTDLAAFIAPGLELPIGGKTYHVPEPGIREGLYLQAIVDTGETLAISMAIMGAERKRSRSAKSKVNGVVTEANRAILTDEEERNTYQLALGAAYDEMVADGVSWPRLKHAGMTALIRWTRDLETAERYWDRYGQGKATPAAETTSPQPDTSPADPSTQSPA